MKKSFLVDFRCLKTASRLIARAGPKPLNVSYKSLHLDTYLVERRCPNGDTSADTVPLQNIDFLAEDFKGYIFCHIRALLIKWVRNVMSNELNVSCLTSSLQNRCRPRIDWCTSIMFFYILLINLESTLLHNWFCYFYNSQCEPVRVFLFLEIRDLHPLLLTMAKNHSLDCTQAITESI